MLARKDSTKAVDRQTPTRADAPKPDFIYNRMEDGELRTFHTFLQKDVLGAGRDGVIAPYVQLPSSNLPLRFVLRAKNHENNRFIFICNSF